MKKIITIIIFITVIIIINSPVFAADSTPSADAKTKLQALQTEIASRAAKIKQEISKKLQNKVYVGFIKSKSASSLTLATATGSKIININEYTQYQGQFTTGKTNKQNINSFVADDFVSALGDIDDTAVLTAKKVIKTASPSAQRQIVFGSVTSLGDRTVVLQTKQGQNFSLLINTGTVFKMGKTDGNLDDIKINKPIIAVGESSSSRTIKTRFIYIHPYSSPLKVKEVDQPATSSGKKK